MVHLFSFKDEEIPQLFNFDAPAKGEFYFIQDGEDVFLYIEGRTEDDTIKVEGQIITEGDEIPDDYETQTVLGTLIEENLVWFIVTTKSPVHAKIVQNVANAWKKKF
jgi:hypothetical protein